MKITVVAAILKDDNLTLVTKEGAYHKLAQGDVRLRPILDQILPVVSTGGEIEVDLTLIETNVFEDFEKKSNGVVKFFRVAKDSLKKWFGAGSIATTIYNGTYGEIPDTPTEVEPEVKAIIESPETREETLQEIVANAKPVTGLVFNTGVAEKELGEHETVIAVVDNNHVIANAENLHAQVSHANKLGDPTAFENFARLVAAVPRQHSMEDLVAFVGKLDLPLTKEGYVLAYKNLNASSEENVYVDPFTNRVRQWVGSRVCMNEKLVDPNRGQDCSNGLHIASRSYLGGYNGSGGTFLVRIKPSDVIAVPKYNTNKMRVCAYEIMGKLSNEDRRAVCANRPLVTDEGKKLLASVIAGQGIAITHQTEITGDRGGGCIYTTIDSMGRTDPSQTEFQPDTLEDLGMVDPIDPEAAGNMSAPTVSPEKINEQLEAGNLSRKDQAKRFYDRWVELVKQNASDEDVSAAYDQLVAYKKSCKTGWITLGLPSEDGKVILVIDVVEDGGRDFTFKTAQGAKAFEEATTDLRDDSQDVENLNQWYDDWLMADSDSKAEYEAAVKIVNLMKIAGFEWDEDGFVPELDFSEEGMVDFEDTISDWERNELANKLSPVEAPVPTAVADGEEQVGGEGTYRERIRRLLNAGSLTIGTAKDILSIKKSAKKGWSALGVTAEEAFDIEQQAKTD